MISIALADAFLAGPPAYSLLQERGAKALGGNPAWLRKLTQRLYEMFGISLVNLDRLDLARIIMADNDYIGAWRSGKKTPRIRHQFLQPPFAGARRGLFARVHLPSLSTSGDLARWAELEPTELDWFTDYRNTERRSGPGPLRHYHYRWMRKRSGAYRLVEVPKERLRQAQRKILRMILDRLPLHHAAHGFRRGHSCATHAAVHVGQEIVIRMDLKNFFPSIPASRIHAMFRTIGYPIRVARSLTALCTNRVPDNVLNDLPATDETPRLTWHERKQYATKHLPQGAPTSPALANLCAFRLDLRLAAAARSLGARYTRYADDLAFSGGELLRQNADRFHIMVCRIALSEGFEVNTRKTRIMHKSVRQQLTGIIVNDRPNITREKYDRLKATLHNCSTSSFEAQNIHGISDYRAYLLGKIAYVQMLNTQRGSRLKKIFAEIDWSK